MIIQKYYRLSFWALIGFSFIIQSCAITKKSGSKSPSSVVSTSLKGAKKVAFDETYFNGLSAKYAGDYKMAAMYFEQCLKLAPTNSSIHFELSQMQMQLGLFESAIQHAVEAVNAQPENVWYLENLAHIYQKSSDYPKAAEIYQKLVSAEPKQLSYYYELGSAYLYADNVPMAIKTYEALEQQMGFETQLALQLVKLYVNQEQYNLAEQKLVQVVENNPDEVQYKAMLAKFYQEQNQIEKAIAIYEQMKIDTPNDPYVKMALYEFYIRQNNRKEAFENLRQAFESDEIGINPKLKIILGLLDQTQKDPGLKKEIPGLFETVIKLHPKEASGYAFYGEFLSNEKQLEEAQKMLLKAIAIDNSVYQVWNQLLFVESDMNQTDSLLKHSLACIELYPNQVIPFYFSGVIYLQKQNFEKAVYYLEEAKLLAYGIKELEIQIESNLGDAYYQMGNFQKAWIAYESALRQDPSNDYVLNNYAYFLCLENEELEKALEMSKRTVENNPNSAVYLDTYGWILYANEQYDQAVIYLEKAVANDSDKSGEIFEHLGDAYFKLGNKEEAFKWWKKAQSAGGATPQIDDKLKNKSL